MATDLTKKPSKWIILLMALVVLTTAGCGKTTPSQAPSSSAETSTAQEQSAPETPQPPLGQLRVGFNFTPLDQYSTNQVAVWIEDQNGSYIDTVYVTRFTSAGGMIKRPNSLPIWVEKSKWDPNDVERVHAVTQATPTQNGPLAVVWDCTDEKGQPVSAGNYVYLVETNIDGENRIIWRGSFTVGGAEMQAPATAEYLPETADKLEAPVSEAEAVYTPAA